MTERIEKLVKRMKAERQFPICTEKARIWTRVFEENPGQPLIVRRAMAEAAFMDERTLFVDADQMLPYNMARDPFGIELRPTSAAWPDDDLQTLLDGGVMTVSEEDHKVIRSLDDYWLNKNRSYDELRANYLKSNKKLYDFAKRGFCTPPYSPVQLLGAAGDGWCGRNPTMLFCPLYEVHIKDGFAKYVADAKERLENISFTNDPDAFEKVDYLNATIIVFEACIRMGRRYAEMYDDAAAKETDPVRKANLEEMAKCCHQVPEFGARTFREALTAWCFFWNMLAAGTTPLGRMDQYLYPYYKADIEAGRITDEEVLELLSCMRLKVMEFNYCQGGKFQREKWAGMARWNNCIIGGCDKDGKDATNELSYLLLESANWVRSPHPTMTIRVGKDTPQALLEKGVQIVSTGIGLPAFISEDEYINYIASRGVDIETAREFAIAGCLDITVPGKARMPQVAMFVMPAVMECAFNNGQNPADGMQYGPETGYLRDFDTYEKFYDAFMKQIKDKMITYRANGTVKFLVDQRLFQDAATSGFAYEPLKECRDVLCRKMIFENGTAFNVVGMVNTINSLAAIKKLVYEDKVCTPAQMHEALLNDWKGYEDLQKKCLEVPKFGNDDAYVDDIGDKFWSDVADLSRDIMTMWGEPMILSGISISAHAPGGRFLGATPDGRNAGATLADGSVSPVQGTDKNGPLAVFKSGMKMSKGWSVNLMNMKFHPSALKTSEDWGKLASLIRTYLTNGGKHVQFNVVDSKELIAARENPAEHKDLIVRVAGYSAYYVELTERIQKEVLERTAHVL